MRLSVFVGALAWLTLFGMMWLSVLSVVTQRGPVLAAMLASGILAAVCGALQVPRKEGK